VYVSSFVALKKRTLHTMQEDELKELIEACRAAPHSDALLRAMIVAAQESQTNDAAIQYLSVAEPAKLKKKDTRLLAGDFLRQAGHLDLALRWFQSSDAISQLRRVRTLIEAGRTRDAEEVYSAVKRADRSLRDEDIEIALKMRRGDNKVGATVIDLAGRKISNEMTSPDERRPRVRDWVTFTDVGGLEDIKAQIRRRIVLPFRNPELFNKYKRSAGGGILMFGPPGCGKTLLARATAGECDASFHTVRIPEILDMYLGESEKKLAAVFEAARNSIPSVIFFDEIEAVAARRRFGTHDSLSTLVSAFLSELDGVGTNNGGILILAATNVPWSVDAAFRRPGRFDRVIFIPPPDRHGRMSILESLLRDRPTHVDIDLEWIAGELLLTLARTWPGSLTRL
jgi:transitional endoplasmic reticulum ATPase